MNVSRTCRWCVQFASCWGYQCHVRNVLVWLPLSHKQAFLHLQFWSSALSLFLYITITRKKNLCNHQKIFMFYSITVAPPTSRHWQHHYVIGVLASCKEILMAIFPNVYADLFSVKLTNMNRHFIGNALNNPCLGLKKNAIECCHWNFYSSMC